MDVLQHAIAWCKGEIFEGRFIVLFGLLAIVSALLCWKIGTTPNAKALFYPLLAIGILFGGIGGGMLYSNPKRIATFTEQAKENPQVLLEAELKRTEEFMSWYPITRYVAAGLGVLGIALFVFWGTPIGRAVGIALILATVAVFIVDHFSEERAEIYRYALIKAQ